jgi:protein-L-isoaspartate(D-aspartate) O-methyltransferase
MRSAAFLAVSLLPTLVLSSPDFSAQRRTTKMAAWRSRAENQHDLVRDLIEADLLRSPDVIDAFQRVDRGWFLPAGRQDITDTTKRWVPMEDAYFDTPQPIGYHVTISAPHMHAMMAELLYRSVPGGMRGKSVLDIGSGSGYLTAVLGVLVGDEGRVLGVEHVESLVESSRATVHRFMPELENRVQFQVGDGRLFGANRKDDDNSSDQYDLIHVGAAADKIPHNLVRLLRPRGRLVLPVGPSGAQELLVVDKGPDGTVRSKKAGDVMFVPLTALDSQLWGEIRG